MRIRISTSQSLYWLVVGIIVLLPLHAVITVWLSSIVGHYTAVRLWKEVLLVLLSGIAVYVVYKNPAVWRTLWSRKYIRLLWYATGAYILLLVGLGVLAWQQDTVTTKALGYGFISDLRFPIFLCVATIAGAYESKYVKTHWQKLILYPAAIVMAFGLLQLFVLPHDILKHVGYGPETISPYTAVDHKPQYARVQSTLRGPNPLGAYLVLVITTIVALVLRKQKDRKILGLGIIAVLLTLYGTYSRSAWIGAAIAFGVLVWLLASDAVRKKLLLVGIGLVLIGAAGVFALRNNNTIQNVFFHTDETSKSRTSSNTDRASAITGGLKDIAHDPFGKGTGSAGPASVYNGGHSRIAEDYFIQIGQESGVVGLVLFVAICGILGVLLWRIHRQTALASILLASLVGVSVVNLLSHAWADDTLAYVWWGLAGLTVGAFYGKKAK